MAEAKITLTIDGRRAEAPAGSTIMEACRGAGVDLPSLCHLEGVSSNASCGICVVEVAGAKSLVRSCVQLATEGMEVKTDSPRLREARRTTLELILANHPDDCLSCLRGGSCELQDLAERLGARRRPYPPTRTSPAGLDAGPAIVRDEAKCVLCGRCVAVCRGIQGVEAIEFALRGLHTHVSTFMNRPLAESACVSCGQCTLVCPTGALTENDQGAEVLEALSDPGRTVLVEVAPAIRASLGEALGMPPGSLQTGRLAAALRRLGFSRVFDTQFSADLTIMEEGSELIARLKAGGVLPMITSCSPGWIDYIEGFYPDLLPHLSTCKSPQQMFGAVAKTWWAAENGIDPASLSVVSVMPCLAKKREAARPEMAGAAAWWETQGRRLPGMRDVDWALSTRELARLLRRRGIDFASLPEEGFDHPLGESTGAAALFATTGGVMEAAARTVYEVMNGKPLETLEISPLRGMEGIREAELGIPGGRARFAVAHTLKNARILLEEIRAGKSPYAFIEVMSCPGGCVGGGGQPLLGRDAERIRRQEAVYREDARLPLRKSHENPAVGQLYREFLGEPLGELSHRLLHTAYQERAF